uniref:Uncharacterized protein n=1 Tax=Cacopsylla melanoneura TaxID=428564 RepID=A0A8D9BVJ2_9HEMI
MFPFLPLLSTSRFAPSSLFATLFLFVDFSVSSILRLFLLPLFILLHCLVFTSLFFLTLAFSFKLPTLGKESERRGLSFLHIQLLCVPVISVLHLLLLLLL